MAYIGKKPTAAPLTSSDVTDGIITTAKIAADAVTDAKIADDVVGTEHLTAGEVDATAIANDAITLAKMAGGTDGNVISYDASGNPVAIATGSDGQVLTSTGAGSPPAFEAAAAGGAWNLIKTLTASASGTLSFVNGASDVVLDSTYNHYVFACNTIHGSASSAALTFQGSIDTGSNYNPNILSCVFVNYASGTASDHSLEVRSNLQDGTGFQMLTEQNGIAASSFWSGELHLYNPASTTFQKQFKSAFCGDTAGGYLFWMNVAGRMETTSAVDAVQFKMASGNIDSGTISLYGISST